VSVGTRLVTGDSLTTPRLRAVTVGHEHPRITVFAGSALGYNPLLTQAAQQLGTLLALYHIDLVFGGTNGGLMGVAAEAACVAGGRVIGVVPTGRWPELESEYCTILYRVPGPDLQARKALMSYLADAYLVLPGGLGTLDELFEVVALARLEQPSKPIGLVNVQGFYDPLLQLFDHLEHQGLLDGGVSHLLAQEPTPALALERIGPLSPKPAEAVAARLALTTVPGTPTIAQMANRLDSLRVIIRRLYEQGGCPWGSQQTHYSTQQYVLEEALEVAQVLEEMGPHFRADEASPELRDHFIEELGDLLMQVLVQTDLSEREGWVTLEQVFEHLRVKLLHRNPHIFGSAVQAHTLEDVETIWQSAKSQERQERHG
jgi:uncharacterized protein (TIGR00730 family)